MSENENQPPTPSKQTSSVPLKKETVRVTLKAADAPAVPSSTVPLAPPVRPPVPGGAPRPPAPTIPLRPSGASTAPAPTIPLRPSGASTAPAPTIRLASSAAAFKPSSPGAPTGPLTPPGSTPTLPKATVQLQPPTAPLGATSPSLAPSLQIEDDEEADPQEGLLNILSGVGLAAALVVLVLQLMCADVWISAKDNPKTGEWSQLIE
jgi:hypothetical protein